MTAEFKRLGKRGSYRLGQLRAQGIRELGRPALFLPRFNRPDHALPVSAWLLGLLLGAATIAGGAYFGSWFMPFVVGLLAWAALHGQAYGVVARELGAFGGLPGHASVGLGLTVLVAVAQVTVGYWLGRAMTPLPPRS